ncbi:MAG: ABC transporter permease [Bacteroidota bacterium]
MLKSYFKSALRSLRMQPGLALINLFGLAVGLACCILITLYLQDELGYDSYHENGPQIHRVVIDYTTNGVKREQGYTQGMLAPLLKEEIPEISDAVRLLGTGGIMSYGDRQFNETRLIVSDPAVFSVFSFELLRGAPEEVLSAPGSIVLTEMMAEKYFGRADPIGEVLQFSNDRQLTVTGIVAAPPAQSHFTFEGIISMATLDTADAPSWMFSEWLSTFVQTYVLLGEGTTAPQVEAKIAGLVERRAGEMMRGANRWVDLYLEPLSTIYLTSERDGLGTRGSLTNLYVFGFIAGFILLIACINFMNLATARAMRRAREVGVRKSLGAARQQLVLQFLLEALFTTLLATALAVGLAGLSMGAFNDLAGKSLGIQALLDGRNLLVLFAMVGIVTLLAGSYPALVLSGFEPMGVLKGKMGNWRRGEGLRKSLVVFQFAISIALIVATGVVYYQLQFMKGQQLGFEKEQVLVLDFQGDDEVQQQLPAIKSEMRRQPGVLAVSTSQTVPGRGLPASGGAVQLADGVSQDISVGLYMVDFPFVDLYQMEMVAGRDFNSQIASDSTAALLLNETAVAQLGLSSPEDALGLEASFWGNAGRVVGVVRDIHHFALQTSVTPMALRIDRDNQSLFSVRIAPENISQTVAALQGVWQQMVPSRPFTYEFLDETFDAQYRAEERFGRVFFVFTVLALLIACLGLFGLAAYTVAYRTKEIGIRKVLGASTQSVILLLSKDFTQLVLIAVCLATPAAYFAMQSWLEAFPYRIGVPWWLFVGAGALALIIASLTVGAQSLRAANTNPVEALKRD